MSQGLSTYSRRLVEDPTRFALELTVPVLVWEGPPESAEEQLLFATQAGSGRRPAVGEGLVFELVKKKTKLNAFALGITLGRTENNDLVIEDNSVSRFHGFFQADGARWKFVDADSKLGTKVNGTVLEKSKAMPLPDMARLKVGQVELFFFMPRAFIEYLQGHVRP